MSERRLGRSIAARLERLEAEPDPGHAGAPSAPTSSQPNPPAKAPPAPKPATSKPAGPVTCANCGTVNASGETFCKNCGSFLEWAAAPTSKAPASAAGDSPSVAAPKPSMAPSKPAAQPDDVICPNCGTPNDPNRTYCRKCATELNAAPATPPPPAPVGASPDPRPSLPSAVGPPNLEAFADYLTAYVPTWVVSLFLPLWGALIASEAGGTEFGQGFKLGIAIATAVAAGLWVWSEGYRTARVAAASRRRRRRVRPLDALRVGAWEVLAASLAAFAWATAAPSSWASFSSAFWPLATVIAAAVVLGVAGNFLAPLEGER